MRLINVIEIAIKYRIKLKLKRILLLTRCEWRIEWSLSRLTNIVNMHNFHTSLTYRYYKNL